MKTIKEWLAQNGYGDILKRINAVERGWDQKRTGTRRNWWDVLAGNKDGSPKTIEGKKFPVLCSARKRKDWPMTQDCISHNPTEEGLPVIPQGRWGGPKETASPKPL